jgi:sarcosine oxidase, subunit delta
MLQLHCPYCREVRDEEEFSYAGEAYVARPSQPDAVDDRTWGEYVFMRRNPKGWHWEQWQHSAGCRKVFVAKRHTGSYEVAGSWTLGEGRAIFAAEQEATNGAHS